MHQHLNAIRAHLQKKHDANAFHALEALYAQYPGDPDVTNFAVHFFEHTEVRFGLRLRAARLVGQYGDPRPGVCTLQPVWCAPFPADTYVIGTQPDPFARTSCTPFPLQLQEFRIARYLVTVWQYRQFLAAQGYADAQWWTSQGWQWLQPDGYRISFSQRPRPPKRITQPSSWDPARSNTDNQPVAGVSWYEAMAFCQWLTHQGHAEGWLPAGQIIRLPTEAEWEVAAMWDLATKQTRAWYSPHVEFWQNVKETEIEFPSPVGMFPLGASPCGALDMAGNMWEWCASPYEGYPATANHQPHDYAPDKCGPAIRGGSYYVPNERSGWGARNWWLPVNQDYDGGFRCLVCAATEV